MQINWLWLVVGLIPYSIKRQHTKSVQMLSIRALFWRLTIHWEGEKCSWDVSIPLITHLKQ
jgi:hypothetical protein